MDQVCVGRMVEGVERFASGEEFVTERFHFAAGGCVSHNDGIGHVGDEAVADHCGLSGDMTEVVWERGYDEKTTFVNRLAKFFRDLSQHSASQTPDDRVL